MLPWQDTWKIEVVGGKVIKVSVEVVVESTLRIIGQDY